MRRFLVIILTLLFPLNVLALSMSISDAQPDRAVAMAAAGAEPFECDTRCDIDPDEPPSTADLHDIISQGRCPPPSGLAAGAAPPQDAAPFRHSFKPPVRPPRHA